MLMCLDILSRSQSWLPVQATKKPGWRLAPIPSVSLPSFSTVPRGLLTEFPTGDCSLVRHLYCGLLCLSRSVQPARSSPGVWCTCTQTPPQMPQEECCCLVLDYGGASWGYALVVREGRRLATEVREMRLRTSTPTRAAAPRNFFTPTMVMQNVVRVNVKETSSSDTAFLQMATRQGSLRLLLLLLGPSRAPRSGGRPAAVLRIQAVLTTPGGCHNKRYMSPWTTCATADAVHHDAYISAGQRLEVDNRT